TVLSKNSLCHSEHFAQLLRTCCFEVSYSGVESVDSATLDPPLFSNNSLVLFSLKHVSHRVPRESGQLCYSGETHLRFYVHGVAVVHHPGFLSGCVRDPISLFPDEPEQVLSTARRDSQLKYHKLFSAQNRFVNLQVP